METTPGTWPSVVVVSTNGVAVQILKADFDRLVGQTLTIELKPPAPVAGDDWYTVSDAARELLQDVDGLDMASAGMRVNRAVNRGEIVAVGHGRDRRIDPATFAMWLRSERRKAADREDEEELDERILAHRKRVERGE